MRYLIQHMHPLQFVLLAIFLLPTATASVASDVCSAGVGTPPFLASGVSPNLLMMIDNSSSMYDPAYDDATTPGYCNDDSYSAATAYGGYFGPANRYYYNFNPAAGDFKKFKSPAAADHCAAAAGTVYSNADVCITINSGVVTAFAASGNFLNWATASKFDIEKGILTGGKYDTPNQRLIPESRGCQGKRMIKQVAVTDNADTPFKLTLGVWPGAAATDHLTRMEVFNASTNGLEFDNGACEAALEATAFGQVQNLAGECLNIGQQNESFANSNAAFNHGFQTCWGYPTIGNGDIQRMENACKNVYDAGVNPTSITETDSGYVCMGDHATGSGYVGRCVVATGGTPAVDQTCTDIACAPDGHPYGGNNNQQCANGFVEECLAGSTWQAETTTGGSCATGTYQAARTYYDCPGGFTLNEAHTLCTKSGKPSVAPTISNFAAGCYDHQDVLVGQPTATVVHPAGCYESGMQTYWVRKQNCVGGTPAVPADWHWVEDAADAGGCIEEALRDYCSGLYDPGLVDPSSPVSSVTDDHFPNLPAILVTVATNAQLGEPIATLDGYIEQATAPQGLLQEFSSDLRMGAMRFTQEGTKHECAQANPPRLYNCTADNKDGGRIISYIEANNSSELVNAINGIVADAWTPLAESMYNAVGYYTQNSSVRLDSYDFFTGGTASFVQGKTYAAGSVVWNDSKWWRTALGGVSRGASPSTDAAAGGISDWQEMTYPAWANSTNYAADAIVRSEGLLYKTASGGTSNGDSALTDNGVTWTLYYDPVVAPCQSNNILVITDGAPTADQATAMTSFVTSDATHNDGDNDPLDPDNDGLPGCGKYTGSTYLDDLAKYAASADLYYTTNDFIDGDGNPQEKKPINTYVVAAGTIRDEGSGECNPTTLLADTAANGGTNTFYASEDPTQLKNNLRTVFSTIRAGAAAGSAASVISASRGGEGAIYQAIFWPSIEDGQGQGGTVDWLGEVHALFIDAEGFMYEDSNHNRTLDLNEIDPNNNDKRTVLFYDESGVSPRTKACIDGQVSAGACSGATKELSEVQYLWSANDWLAKMSNADTRTNRGTYLSNSRQRYVFTWEDLNNDGITDADEVLPFQDRSGADWNWDDPDIVAANRGLAYKDFNANDAAEANQIINWIRGDNSIAGRRLREAPSLLDLNGDGAKEAPGIWRLGDVIDSTPVAVSKPTEAYHVLYRDSTYAAFFDRYKDRRHMIYFGGNDGMLHAINGGFYNADDKKFCLSADCTNEANQPELGAELWGYVPYNLLPHLKCLTASDYKEKHKYFVDLRPRIFDVKIFTEEGACSTSKTASGCIHPNGWGTILVGGMRFGGSPMSAVTDLNSGVAADKRVFTSSYFIFDITNPDTPPSLLGELTHTTDTAPNDQVELGYTTANPTIVPMNNKDTGVYSWSLILGSGPTTLEGKSTQPPKLAVLPLSWLTGTPKHPLRIPDLPPSDATSQGGAFDLGAGTGLAANYNGFVSDLITADFDLSNFMADSVYFGTVDCRGQCDTLHPTWGGTLYRLVTRKHSPDGEQQASNPSDWGTLLADKGLTNPLPLLDVAQPITGAPTVATDGDNYWVYFGTGRFINASIDKTDSSQQSFYGIKEPQDCNRDFTWATVAKGASSQLLAGTGLSHDGTPGRQGILQVDQILVQSGTTATTPISCIPSAADATWGTYFNAASNSICNALVTNNGINTFKKLQDYITGTPGECTADENISSKHTGADGWFRNFSNARERNLGQAAILGGLSIFTTYQPYSDICQSEGLAFLYGLHYQTGTAFYKPTLGVDSLTGETPAHVLPRVKLGRGLATTPNLHVGVLGAKAFIQTSTGEIKEIETDTPLSEIKSGRSGWKDIR